ncbi:MAG: pyridoxamine 5'-phosphate oxidase family protein [Deltaproteobacteria bacterium]|nr:pyridoxamine 5'-phosphate oxidase family protein [Deltaproteobacteria bacterium]
MRRSDKQIIDITGIEAVVRSGEICHLAMVDKGRPYVVPVNYGYANGALYFHSAPAGRKINILRKNPDVCFSIVSNHGLVKNERACSWSAKYRSVIGTGRAVILDDRIEKEKGLSILMKQYSDQEYDFSGEDLTGVVVIRVKIEEMKGKGELVL